VSSLVAPTTAAVLSAGVTTKSNGTEFKATFVPLKAFDVRYIEVLSETKLVLQTDSATSLSRIGLTFAYNPFSLRSKRGMNVIARSSECHACDTFPAARLAARQKKLDPASARLEGAKGQVAERNQQLVEARARFDEALTRGRADEVGEAHSTLKRAHEALASAIEAQKVALREFEESEKSFKQEAADLDSQADTCEAKRQAWQWTELNGTLIPQVSLTSTIDLYPSGTTQSPTNPDAEEELPLEAWGGTGLELAVSFRPAEQLSIDIWGSYRRVRASGLPDTKLANYTGGGATVSWLFLLNKAKLDSSPDYIKEGFMPGFAVGASVQATRCDGGEQCMKQRPDQRSITPFVDIRLKPQLQLRISLPIISYTSVAAKTGDELAPSFSVAGVISSL
jgi:hypothetical protein